MNYKKYARLLIEAEKNKSSDNLKLFLDNFLLFLKKKNETNLLPKILKEVENIRRKEQQINKTKVILKNKEEFEK
jgi:F0F1-type ATP synthase delta subunit